MRKLKKIFIFTVIILLISFFCQGCIVFHSSYSKKDDLGFYVKHYTACGPIALEKTLNSLGEDVTRKEISREIQSGGNVIRTSLSIIHYEGVLVTWPSEIEKIIKKYGYKIKVLKDMSELKNDDIAIILVKGKAYLRQLHWMCFPIDSNIKNYYPKGTEIIKIYKIIK